MQDTSMEKVFQALSSEDCQALLVGILNGDSQTVPRQFLETDGSDANETDRRLQTEAYQEHLPTLEEYGFVEWNKDAGKVVRGPSFDEIRPLVLSFERSSRGVSKLTDNQQTLLESAVRNGYFEVPRKISTKRLAEDLNVSSLEASEELRRGLDTTLQSILIRE